MHAGEIFLHKVLLAFLKVTEFHISLTEFLFKSPTVNSGKCLQVVTLPFGRTSILENNDKHIPECFFFIDSPFKNGTISSSSS